MNDLEYADTLIALDIVLRRTVDGLSSVHGEERLDRVVRAVAILFRTLGISERQMIGAITPLCNAGVFQSDPAMLEAAMTRVFEQMRMGDA